MSRAMRLRLTEYQRSDSPIALGDEARRVLSEVAPSINLSPGPNTGDYYLTPSSFVGVVEVEDLVVEVWPKIDLQHLFFMLSYAIDPKAWKEGDPSLHLQGFNESLSDLLIWMFAEHVGRAISRGLLHGYVHEDDSLMTVRGRIRLDDQLRLRYGAIPPVECSFEEFTADIPENRLIKTALQVTKHAPLRSDFLRRKLRRLDYVFHSVSPGGYDRRSLPTFVFTRLNEHYRRSLHIAALLLRGTEVNLNEGSIHANAFMFNMNSVFQEFVAVALREELDVTSRVLISEQPISLDKDSSITMYPDISWWDTAGCQFVGDVKYKKEHAGSVPNADVYQALAYATALELPSATLIYASGEDEPRVHQIAHVHKTIEVIAVELDATPEVVLGQLAQIAAGVRSKVRGRSSAMAMGA